MHRGDTIAAISSSVGPAARMIVRLSGAQTKEIASKIRVPPELLAASATRLDIAFDSFAFSAWVYVFHAPHSYSGDDLIELHIPGNTLLASRLLEHLLRHGARAAEPGEFTARAFFNGRIDLSTAEGVAAVIGAGNEQELLAGRQLMAGELARCLKPIMASLIQTLALVEVGIDFSQEDVTVLAVEEQAARIAQADRELELLLSDSARFVPMSHEPRVVLVGRPNSGKSTLLNVLAGRARAIVSPVAGTTRDALSDRVALPRGYVHLTDVAGVDENESADPISQQMQDHTLRALAEADVVILLHDATDTRPLLILSRQPDLIVFSKTDLRPRFSPAFGTPGESWGRGSAGALNARKEAPLPNPPRGYRRRGQEEARGLIEISSVVISARTGIGMEHLIGALDSCCFGETSARGTLSLNIRHVSAIESARCALARSVDLPDGEFAAADLREALNYLGSILGEVSPDDVLGEIFSGFCIGK